ncbi:MAG: thermonuclease family protein [archaeon]|nr:thermonuclease family protein [archaeon]
MNKKVSIFSIFILLILILISISACVQQSQPIQNTDTNSEKELALVIEVIDGDTLKLASGEKVRLIGINAPEKKTICSEQAAQFLREQTENKTVELEKEQTDLDQYGRKLRNVFVEGKNVNILLVRNGLATVYLYENKLKYLEELKQAEYEAQKSNECIWKKSEEIYSLEDCIQIKEFHFDAEGNDNENLNDEFIEFENKCNYEIFLNDWTIKDEGTNFFYFPKMSFEKKSVLTLFSGNGTDSNAKVYWNSKQAIWNNDGDRMFLRNEKGELALFFEYRNS